MAKKITIPKPLSVYTELKGTMKIDMPTIKGIFETSYLKVLQSKFGEVDNLKVECTDDGIIDISQDLEVVADGKVANPAKQIALSEAKKENSDAAAGDRYIRKITNSDFTQAELTELNQCIKGKVADLQKEALYTKLIIDQFSEFKENKSIDKPTMIGVIVFAFRKALQSKYGDEANFDVICNPDNGDFSILQNLEVVADGEVENPNKQISLSDAILEGNSDAEIGDVHARQIKFSDFGRRDIISLRQALQGKVIDLQKEALYNKYKDMVGELISGEVYQAWSKECLILDNDKNELHLPKTETIAGEFFHKGDPVRAVVKEVGNEKNNPRIILSRTSPDLLRRLFELEVPEIHDGLVTIQAVARIPGERAKVAVESIDDRIDAVGACVGVKGSRIHGIVRELRNENIDVINYTSNPSLMIQRALSPARVKSLRIDEEKKYAEVFFAPEQVSLAIGRGGTNIKLASILTGYTIEVFRDGGGEFEDDIYLEEFKDEIDAWVIDTLLKMGLTKARQVLATPREQLIDEADLEEETVDHLLEVLRAEFED